MTDIKERLREKALEVEGEAWKRHDSLDWCLGAKLLHEAANHIAALEERLHYCNGVADLAMKHRDEAEAKVAALEAKVAEQALQTKDLAEALSTLLDLIQLGRVLDKLKLSESDHKDFRWALSVHSKYLATKEPK